LGLKSGVGEERVSRWASEGGLSGGALVVTDGEGEYGAGKKKKKPKTRTKDMGREKEKPLTSPHYFDR
jgi:hypothetical protein